MTSNETAAELVDLLARVLRPEVWGPEPARNGGTVGQQWNWTWGRMEAEEMARRAVEAGWRPR